MRRWKQLAVACAFAMTAGTTLAIPAHADDWNWGRDRWFSDNDRGWYSRSDARKERRYERRMNNDREGDAERLNDRLCNNGIPGDAPAGC